MRVLVALLVGSLLIAGCGSSAATPAPSAWGDRVPEPAPSALAARTVVSRGPDSITLLPISPSGASIGINYRYEMPHCGIRDLIDIDGSFWDALDIDPSSVAFDGRSGHFRLTSPTSATFTSDGGEALNLARHDGAKQFGLCS